MSSVSSLIAARKRGDADSLRALAVALSAVLSDTPEQSTDPVEAADVAETRMDPAPGTWQEVRAARDHGDLTEAEYQYLAAALDALTQEES